MTREMENRLVFVGMVGKNRGRRYYTGVVQGDLCEDGIVLHLNYSGVYTIYTCDKTSWNYAHTLH